VVAGLVMRILGKVRAEQFMLSYVLDLVAGDPEWFPHPVRLWGAMITWTESRYRPRGTALVRETAAGALLTAGIVSAAWLSAKWRAPMWQVLLGWTTLATRSLLDEARAVIGALESGDLDCARQRLSRIVGRDTAQLDETEIVRGVIETLAESACDGIVAPLFWLAAGGVPAAMAYKAVNTLDSMIGHPEAPYCYFGRVAARLDDAANLIPARATALTIVVAAKLLGRSSDQGLRVWLRDGGKHASPNAGQTEAAMAGALGVRLGGGNTYGGQPRCAPVLNAEGRVPTRRDARAALAIVAAVSAMSFGLGLLVVSWRRA
jgi:adenosylcobinamide-phosphate synthase